MRASRCRSVPRQRRQALGPARRQEGAAFLPLLVLRSSLGPSKAHPLPPNTSLTQAAKLLEDNAELDHEYLPIAGLPEFTGPAAKLLLGAESKALAEGRVTTCVAPCSFSTLLSPLSLPGRGLRCRALNLGSLAELRTTER